MPPDLTSQQAATAAAMAMRRNPSPTVHDVGTPVAQRALAQLQQLQPHLAGRFADSALLAARRQYLAARRPAGARGRPCAWHLARLLATRWGLPAPRYTADHVALLGQPCDQACRAAILPKPTPKPKPQPARRASAPGGQRTRVHRPAQPRGALRAGRKTGTVPRAQLPDGALEQYATAVVAAAVHPVTPKRAAYNLVAAARLGIPPERVMHLVQPR